VRSGIADLSADSISAFCTPRSAIERFRDGRRPYASRVAAIALQPSMAESKSEDVVGRARREQMAFREKSRHRLRHLTRCRRTQPASDRDAGAAAGSVRVRRAPSGEPSHCGFRTADCGFQIAEYGTRRCPRAREAAPAPRRARSVVRTIEPLEACADRRPHAMDVEDRARQIDPVDLRLAMGDAGGSRASQRRRTMPAATRPGAARAAGPPHPR